MNAILRDLATPALVCAIEENLYCFITALGQWPRAEVHQEPGLSWSITDLPFSLFNSVMRTRLTTDEVDAAIDCAVARAKARKVPISWWTGPSTQPADLALHLRKHGFCESEVAPGMAVDLAHLTEVHPTLPGLTVEIARDAASRAEWGLTSSLGFGSNGEFAEHVGSVWSDLLSCVRMDTIVPYLGRLNGKPVATSMLMYGAGVAGIYAVATLPEARRKGIGAVMTAMPLQAARDAGYTVGILQASEMGVGVYRSLGFREYCKIYEYVWRPPAD